MNKEKIDELVKKLLDELEDIDKFEDDENNLNYLKRDLESYYYND